MEMKDKTITILYTSGVNTTCVAVFSISNGVPEYRSTETIAWNEGGKYRTSSTFARYAHLVEKRDGPNQAPDPTALAVTPAADAPVAPAIGRGSS
jgi:hypothetical protein